MGPHCDLLRLSPYIDRKRKNFETGSQKIFFWKACEKLFKDFYSRFLISCHQRAIEVFEVLSVAMTSSPEVVRTKKFSLIFGFSDLLNSILNRFTGLRFARPNFPHPKMSAV